MSLKNPFRLDIRRRRLYGGSGDGDDDDDEEEANVQSMKQRRSHRVPTLIACETIYCECLVNIVSPNEAVTTPTS
jgi:hypothetical protein